MVPYSYRDTSYEYEYRTRIIHNIINRHRRGLRSIILLLVRFSCFKSYYGSTRTGRGTDLADEVGDWDSVVLMMSSMSYHVSLAHCCCRLTILDIGADATSPRPRNTRLHQPRYYCRFVKEYQQRRPARLARRRLATRSAEGSHQRSICRNEQ